ncbi:MAG: septal ring lytic transglycosylase RlpA family protein [Desulfobulbaceae bacterium]|nr:septal ring lytic transglycosylase RlpA family protein [Desulfobulbaceae bacterium]
MINPIFFSPSVPWNRLLSAGLLLVFLLTGCGKQPILSTQGKYPVPAPAKKVPETSRIPYTQRPYKIDGKTYYPLPSSHGYEEAGVASWYGRKFHGRRTSNGEIYNMYGKTAAHKTLPMNTHVLVKNQENGREMVLRINDRGPFVKNRIIDLTLTAAQELGMAEKGTARVKITALGEAASFKMGNKKVERFLPHQDFRKGNFYVQIGSFANRNNAENLTKKVSSPEKRVDILPFDKEGTIFYRVQVQAGTTLSEAKEVERSLVALGYSDAFVVAR